MQTVINMNINSLIISSTPEEIIKIVGEKIFTDDKGNKKESE